MLIGNSDQNMHNGTIDTEDVVKVSSVQEELRIQGPDEWTIERTDGHNKDYELPESTELQSLQGSFSRWSEIGAEPPNPSPFGNYEFYNFNKKNFHSYD